LSAAPACAWRISIDIEPISEPTSGTGVVVDTLLSSGGRHVTLLLNADARPLSLLPLSSVSWQDAIKSLWIGSVAVLHSYDDWLVHSPSVTMAVPAVVMLKQQVAVRFEQRFARSGPSSTLVFLRDRYQCQYCRQFFPRAQLTMDHVVPRKFGGRSRWDNIATACSPCNAKRGHDTRVQPMHKPRRPSYGHLIKMLQSLTITIPHPTWTYYLGWEAERMRLIDPRR
jgi:5-methylcytosine-specific restriction endonuclease McrA